MKRFIGLLLMLSLTGCMFIVREGEEIKSNIGISRERAKEEISAIDEHTKAFAWPDENGNEQ